MIITNKGPKKNTPLQQLYDNDYHIAIFSSSDTSIFQDPVWEQIDDILPDARCTIEELAESDKEDGFDTNCIAYNRIFTLCSPRTNKATENRNATISSILMLKEFVIKVEIEKLVIVMPKFDNWNVLKLKPVLEQVFKKVPTLKHILLY